jgi:hypothetical protein
VAPKGTDYETLATRHTLNPDSRPPVHRHRVLSFVSLLGIATLSYLVGVVVMFFQLPSSDFLGKALLGARDWYDPHTHPNAKPAAPPPAEQITTAPGAAPSVDRPGETFDGFTLCTYLGQKQPDAEAILMNMRREVVHRWAVPFSRAYPNPTHLPTRLPDSSVWFRRCYVYPNGDLLAVYHGRTLTGAGLAKIDKDSNVLWAFPGAVHHDVDVGDDGTIYALCHRQIDRLPAGLERINVPTVLDLLVVLSPDGELLREPIPLLVALRDSGYAPILEVLKWPTKRFVPPPEASVAVVDRYVPNRVLHSNSVQVLKSGLAPKFPNLKAGDVLISLRDVSTIIMIDPESGKVDWAAQGPWYAQHDAQFLDNGHLLLFDNLGSPHGTRVLEFDPQTGGFPWWYPGENQVPFYTSECGMCQRLPNGNTLIVNYEGGEVREVTRDKKIVWTLRVDRPVSSARRYSAEELPFLGGDVRPRP